MKREVSQSHNSSITKLKKETETGKRYDLALIGRKTLDVTWLLGAELCPSKFAC